MTTQETKKVEWVKSEDAGYAPGKLLLDTASGHISVYKHGRKWIEAHIENGICRFSRDHNTRKDAIASAEGN